MEYKYYGVVGKSECICSTTPPSKNHIEMVSVRPGSDYIARVDGTWVKIIK